MRHRIATTLFLIVIPDWSAFVAADDEPGVIRGKAFIGGSDRPAVRVTLQFFDRQSRGLAAVTDAHGRFRCAPPERFTLRVVRDGREGPPCWVEVQDAEQWTWQPIHFAPFQRADEARRYCFEVLMKPAIRTTWRERGGLASLEVECSPPGEIEVLVRGVGGTPVADRPVQVMPVWTAGESLGRRVDVRYDGRTDRTGRFRMRWTEGPRRLAIVVPGEGYGATGTVAVKAGEITRVEMPPLARLGSIEGRVDAKLAGPATSIALEESGPYEAESACDPEGRFELRDVKPGDYRVRVVRDGRPTGAFARVLMTPGQRVAGVVIAPPAPAPAANRPAAGAVAGRAPGRPEEVPIVEGTVRDEQGRGVVGATVYARATFDGGMRMAEMIQSATTNDRGRYQIRGPRVYGMSGPVVIAHRPGRPLGLAYAPPPENIGRSVALDLTLPDESRGGSARVTVLRDGKPLAGAHVRMESDYSVMSPSHVGRGAASGPAATELYALLHPAAVAGPDGVARFSGLTPGSYRLFAVGDGPGHQGGPFDNRGDASGGARGIGIVSGRETAFTVALHRQRCIATFQVLRPDGTPVTGQQVSLRIGPGSYGSLRLDDRGLGSHDFHYPGVWRVGVQFRETPSTTFPVTGEPFDEATALVAASPGMPADPPIRMLAGRREPGSLKVRLLDAEGRPARGTVEVLAFPNEPGLAASTDEHGIAVFRDLPSGSYPLRAHLDGSAAPLLDFSGSWPSAEDSALRWHAIIPWANAAVEPGRETTADLRARPVGYVRGTIRPPVGHQASEYIAYPTLDSLALESHWRTDQRTGRFLAGPLLAGKNLHRFQRESKDGKWQDAGTQVVEVPAGGVAHVELRPDEPGRRASPDRRHPEMAGREIARGLIRDSGGVTSTAVLDVGQTPAFGAQAMLYVPEEPGAIAAGLADVGGRLTWRWGRWETVGPRRGDRPKPVDRPTVIVRLPGLTGAAVTAADPGRPVRVTLPPPRHAEGRVTLGGRPVDGRNAWIRIVAVHRGRGDVLDDAFSLEAIAQADGRFDLNGLTPGRYVVQAARDEIWLSASIEMTVAAEKDPPPLALDIPEPGRAVTVMVRNRGVRPAANQPVGLVRPEGPLASLWPEGLRTGPDGTLELRGLEAGRHTILIGEMKERHEITVPAGGTAVGTEARPPVEQIVVPRAGP